MVNDTLASELLLNKGNPLLRFNMCKPKMYRTIQVKLILICLKYVLTCDLEVYIVSPPQIESVWLWGVAAVLACLLVEDWVYGERGSWAQRTHLPRGTHSTPTAPRTTAPTVQLDSSTHGYLHCCLSASPWVNISFFSI